MIALAALLAGACATTRKGDLLGAYINASSDAHLPKFELFLRSDGTCALVTTLTDPEGPGGGRFRQEEEGTWSSRGVAVVLTFQSTQQIRLSRSTEQGQVVLRDENAPFGWWFVRVEKEAEQGG